jgi:hypothetical protein
MFPDTRNNITYVTFLEVLLSTLEVKEKEAKIKNETFENQEQHSRSSTSPPRFRAAVNNAIRMALCKERSPAVQEVPGSIPD